MTRRVILAPALMVVSVAACRAIAPPTAPVTARVVATAALPKLDGAHIDLAIEEVTYAPGASSTAHRHTCPVLVYVIEGAFRSQIQGDSERVYHAGDTFYEGPNSRHVVSGNASERAPARFLALFACDHAGPRTVRTTDSGPGAAR